MTKRPDPRLQFLKLKGVDPRSDWIYCGTPALTDHELQRREMIVYGGRGSPDAAPQPTPVSSWAECREAGLVEYGWFIPTQSAAPDARWNDKLIWGIKPTWRGRKAMLETFGEQA